MKNQIGSVIDQLSNSEDDSERENLLSAFKGFSTYEKNDLDALVDILHNHPDQSTRVYAAKFLGSVGLPAVQEALFEELKNKSSPLPVRISSYESLILNFPDDRDEVNGLVYGFFTEASSIAERQESAQIMASEQAASAFVSKLVELTGCDNSEIRRIAVSGLAHIQADEVVQPLAQRLTEEENFNVAKHIITTLIALDPEKAVSPLLELLKDTTQASEKHVAALEALRRLPVSENDIQPILEATINDNSAISATAVDILGELFPDRRSRLLVDFGVQQSNDKELSRVADLLRVLDDEEDIVKYLIETKDDYEQERRARFLMVRLGGHTPMSAHELTMLIDRRLRALEVEPNSKEGTQNRESEIVPETQDMSDTGEFNRLYARKMQTSRWQQRLHRDRQLNEHFAIFLEHAMRAGHEQQRFQQRTSSTLWILGVALIIAGVGFFIVGAWMTQQHVFSRETEVSILITLWGPPLVAVVLGVVLLITSVNLARYAVMQKALTGISQISQELATSAGKTAPLVQVVQDSLTMTRQAFALQLRINQAMFWVGLLFMAVALYRVLIFGDTGIISTGLVGGTGLLSWLASTFLARDEKIGENLEHMTELQLRVMGVAEQTVILDALVTQILEDPISWEPQDYENIKIFLTWSLQKMQQSLLSALYVQSETANGTSRQELLNEILRAHAGLPSGVTYEIISSSEGQSQLRNLVGVQKDALLKFLKLADLVQSDSNDEQIARLMLEADVKDLEDLANADPVSLYSTLKSINDEQQLVPTLPSQRDIALLIEEAKGKAN